MSVFFLNCQKKSFRHNGSITVYSGTYGILEYPNKKNESTAIFILENDGNWYIPVPKYYWKIILNEVTKEVAAFVGLNNPHADDIPLKEAFCSTSCSNIAGLVNYNLKIICQHQLFHIMFLLFRHLLDNIYLTVLIGQLKMKLMEG